jgi:hypothetical protein
VRLAGRQVEVWSDNTGAPEEPKQDGDALEHDAWEGSSTRELAPENDGGKGDTKEGHWLGGGRCDSTPRRCKRSYEVE